MHNCLHERTDIALVQGFDQIYNRLGAGASAELRHLAGIHEFLQFVGDACIRTGQQHHLVLSSLIYEYLQYTPDRSAIPRKRENRQSLQSLGVVVTQHLHMGEITVSHRKGIKEVQWLVIVIVDSPG